MIDLGTTPVRFVEFLLPSIPTSQLKILEENSPQLRTETNQIWKLACIRDFISIRILVEDNKLVKEPKSWRKVYLEEEIKQEEKMERLLGKMRTSYDKLADRAHSLHFDGVRAEKKRKLNVRRNSGGTSYREIFTSSSHSSHFDTYLSFSSHQQHQNQRHSSPR